MYFLWLDSSRKRYPKGGRFITIEKLTGDNFLGEA